MEENNLEKESGTLPKEAENDGARKKKKLTGFQKGIIISAISVFLLLISTIVFIFVYIYSVLDYNHNPITKDPEVLGYEEVIDEKIINVALFGIDSRNNTFKGRSDSIMVLSINTTTKKIKIISILRDTLVPIESGGNTTYNKINSAYAKGGPELAISTINKNFGLDISEYATVNFGGMMDIIDAVGGIEVTLIQDEVAPVKQGTRGLNNNISEMCKLLGKDPKDYYILEPGTHTLNGLQAVAYSRIRYVKNVWGTNNDYGRSDRQRFVIEQLFNRAKTLGKAQYLDLVKALVPCTETSFSPAEILDVAYKVMLDSPTFEQVRVPLNEKEKSFVMPTPKGSFGSVVYYDLGYASKIINAFIYDDITFDEFIARNPIEKNDWYAAAIGG